MNDTPFTVFCKPPDSTDLAQAHSERVNPSNACGVIVLDKPEGMSSSAVVQWVRKRLHIKKTGHCGTLDPFATGVLLVCINQATRISDQFLDQDKEYLFTLHLGVETDTLDRTGTVTRVYDGAPCSVEELREAMNRFRGTFVQKVPRYAAIKIQGKRLYQLSRQGIAFEPPSREVHVRSIELISYEWPHAVMKVSCSKGTYVRRLASDIGRILQCGAHVSALRRTASGSFSVEQALTLDRLERHAMDPARCAAFVTMAEALEHLPAVTMGDEAMLERLKNGCLDSAWIAEHLQVFGGCGTPVRILTPRRLLAALWWPDRDEEKERRLRVFHF
ncbi:MAG: tRNA pseudouridine(55) synthase TruB [Syntrophobacteraceae bacterium]|nr:tRNA pseudouridine(55) synthase TruB [Syntrophobacteraceae bacterium]